MGGLVIGIFGFLMGKVLTNPGEIFGFIPQMIGKRWGYDVDTLPWGVYWFAKITFACPKCIAGNFALWYSLFFDIGNLFNNVVLAVFAAYLITKLHERIIE
jgi:hypothetical protein